MKTDLQHQKGTGGPKNHPGYDFPAKKLLERRKYLLFGANDRQCFYLIKTIFGIDF
jgi:hypothetical protein